MDHSHLTAFWQTISLTLFGVLVTVATFWLGVMRHLVKKSEIIELIEHHSPYATDRQSILHQLEVFKDSQKVFSKALENNNQIMSELRTQLAVLAKTLEQLEKRIEDN